MPTWIRRQFTAAGLTQIPAGPHLGSLQGRYGGTVMLCIDVSGSMNGQPIWEAARGALEFVNEAVAAHYNVGVMLSVGAGAGGATALLLAPRRHTARIKASERGRTRPT